MVSYKQQTGEGFALDGAAQFLEQMQSIADWRDAQGNPLAFVVGAGDEFTLVLEDFHARFQPAPDAAAGGD